MVVVGGGIAGLAAAHALAGEESVDSVVVLEASDRVGGKLRSHEVAGTPVDVGAESMLSRRPEGVELARGLGLDLVHPAVATSRLWTRGGLRPLPRTFMGVPFDVEEVRTAGVLSDRGLERLVAERDGSPPTHDVSVAELVGHRLGEEVVDQLVEPLLGGVYAGHARHISARAAVPQLLALAERGPLLRQVAELPIADSPVFAAPRGGMSRLPAALTANGHFEVRTSVTVRELRRHGSGFEVVTGPAPHPVVLQADRVVVATPASAAGRLLAGLAPTAAEELGAIESASVAVVTFAVPASAVPDALREASGFLVPPHDVRWIKASTFSTTKWGLSTEAGMFFLRTSLGRHGEESALHATDDDLVDRSLADLERVLGVVLEPEDTHVQRWGGGLPQYAVGHVDRVARIREDVARVPGLAVCGAAYDGVGVPAVIGSARRAAAEVLKAQ